MHQDLLLNTEIDILVLLLVACLAAIAFKKINFPYTVGLVIIGLLLSFLARNFEILAVFNTFKLSEELILFIFVPPLIFESALNMDSRILLRNLPPVLVLAAPGLLISTAILGFLLSWLTPLTLGQALLFGSLISATDPVAVIALFKELGAPKQLAILVEGESLFNDATAIVTFNIILGIIAAGAVGTEALQQGAINFLVAFFGGIAVGAVFGYLMSFTLNLAKDNSLLLSTLTTITAYGAFLIAEEVFAVSPVMSVVSTGLVIGWYKSNRLEPEAREYVGEFWEYAAFLANSLIFLLVGITASSFQFFEQLSQTQSLLTSLGVTLLAILAARALVVFTLVPLVNVFSQSKIPFSYQLVSYWGGLRGAVCLALALSIDPDFPNHDLIVILTLGVALFTLLIPGTTIGKLIQTLGLNRPSVLDQVGKVLAVLIAKREALKRSNLLDTMDYFSTTTVENFKQTYQQQVAQAEKALRELGQQLNLSEEEVQQVVWSQALAVEQQIYRELGDQGFVSQSVLAKLTLMMNLKTDAIQADQIPPEISDVKSIEMRFGSFLLKFLEGSAWGEKIESDLVSARYEYLTFMAYACEEVPQRLRQMIADTGLSERDAMKNCISYYEQKRQKIIQEAQATVKDFPDLAIASQQKISDRVALIVQNESVEHLASQGIISKGVAGQINLELVESGN